MNVKLVAFGIAKDIVDASSLNYELAGNSITDLKNELVSSFPEFEKLRSLKFAVNEDYQADDYLIQAGDEVVIIPPVSGG